MLLDLLRGLGTSLEIFAFTLLIALPLGFPLALGRMSKNKLLSGLIGVLTLALLLEGIISEVIGGNLHKILFFQIVPSQRNTRI